MVSARSVGVNDVSCDVVYRVIVLRARLIDACDSVGSGGRTLADGEMLCAILLPRLDCIFTLISRGMDDVSQVTNEFHR